MALHNGSFNYVLWSKLLWHFCFPPSKSILIWRLILRSFQLMRTQEELSFLLDAIFVFCTMKQRIIFSFTTILLPTYGIGSLTSPTWIFNIFGFNDCWKVIDSGWSPQCQVSGHSCWNQSSSTYLRLGWLEIRQDSRMHLLSKK